MLELKSLKASLLKKVVESIKDLATDVGANFQCSSTGISLQAMDPIHYAMVVLLLRSDGFDHYRCDRNLSIGIDLGTMAKMLNCASDDDFVTIKADDCGGDCVTFMFESLDENKITNFETKLMDIDDEPLHIAELEYDATVRMPSSEFAKICKDLSTMGDTVVISVTQEGLEFSTKGDTTTTTTTTTTTNIVCRQNTCVDKREEATIIDVNAPVSLTFALRFLNAFTKATPLASQVTLSLASDWPMMVEYKIPEMGHLRFYLAPKMKEDECSEPVETKKRLKRKLKTEPKSNGNMEDKKRHRAIVEKIKEEKLRLKKEEQECKIILLKEEVRMMQQKQMDKDMRFFLTPHDHLIGAALNAVLVRKSEIARRWGWE